MTEPFEDGTTIERLLRVAEEARTGFADLPDEAGSENANADTDANAEQEGQAMPVDGLDLQTPPALAKNAWVGNLCREIPMQPYDVDPAACADAMMAMASPHRTLSAFRRSWAAEVIAGETMIDTMSRVIAEGMPEQPVIGIVKGPGLEQMREEFDALPSCERADEIERHLWAMKDRTRIRTRFSSLLSAIGIG